MMKHSIPDVPYIYQGIVPCCHVTSLRMILEFYGRKHSSSYLINLSGFNYGFKYFEGENRAFACSESPLGPWPFMAFAAEKLGCTYQVIKNKPWDETWGLMKNYIDRNIPVYMPMLNMQYLWKTLSPVPHTVLLCGYDEKRGVVIIHDPGLGEAGEGIQYLPMQYLPPEGLCERELHRGKSGRYANFKIEDFRKACDLRGTPWEGIWKNGLAIISPPSGQPTISWAEAVARNAKLALGRIEEVTGEKRDAADTYGPDGMMKLAADIEIGFGLLSKPELLIGVLGGLSGMTFRLGSAYKRDGEAFLAGLAAATNNKYLRDASYHLRSAAICYDQGLAEIEPILQNKAVYGKDLPVALQMTAETVRKAADYERKAGESMIKAGKALGRPSSKPP
jgi:hypothetical protein